LVLFAIRGCSWLRMQLAVRWLVRFILAFAATSPTAGSASMALLQLWVCEIASSVHFRAPVRRGRGTWRLWSDALRGEK
jgi:hypothetical protein